jgi:hypothetical protein
MFSRLPKRGEAHACAARLDLEEESPPTTRLRDAVCSTRLPWPVYNKIKKEWAGKRGSCSERLTTTHLIREMQVFSTGILYVYKIKKE